VVDNVRVEQLPLNGHNFLQLGLMTAGTQSQLKVLILLPPRQGAAIPPLALQEAISSKPPI
jgi:hypothetical protein